MSKELEDVLKLRASTASGRSLFKYAMLALTISARKIFKGLNKEKISFGR